MKTKLYLIPLLSASLLLGACSYTPASPLDPHSKASNLYAFQAATSIGMIGNAVNSPAVRMAKGDQEAKDALVETLQSYLPSVEAALTGMDAIVGSKEEKSDLAEYETKLTISYKDMAMANTEFTMYYNETILGEENSESSSSEATSELDENSSKTQLNLKEDDDENDEKEELEQESKIEGIIIVDGATYPMYGEKELEDDEYEVSFTYNLDENTIVTVEQEIENNEQEFEYTIVSNNETILEYSIELEKDEVELEIKEQGKVEQSLSFKLIEKDGENLIKAESETGDKEDKLLFKKVTDEEGNVSYIVVE